jgi:hypothetical protein
MIDPLLNQPQRRKPQVDQLDADEGHGDPA